MNENEEVVSVIAIIAEDFKTGHSDKTGKDWSLSKYKASNGIEFSSFDKLEIGDVIRLEKNGEYWNGAKPRKQDLQHDEVMRALRKIYKQNQDILARIGTVPVEDVPFD